MKTIRIESRFLATAAAMVAVLSLSLTPAFSLDPAIAKAAGKYNGNFKGKATGGGTSIRIPKTKASATMPRGKGRCSLNVKGLPKFTGKVTRATVRGNRVVQTGKISVPASQTNGLGKIVGPFRSTTYVGAGSPRMKAKTSFTTIGINIKGVFKGSQ